MAKAKRHTRGRGNSFGEFVESEPELTALTDGALRREEVSKVFEHDLFNFRYKLGPVYDILRYLSKMFQVEVELAPTEQQVRDFLDRQLNAIPYWTKRLSKEHRRLFSDIVLRLARQNPREVKRLLNSSLMAAAGAEMMGGTRAGGALRFEQGLAGLLHPPHPPAALSEHRFDDRHGCRQCLPDGLVAPDHRE